MYPLNSASVCPLLELNRCCQAATNSFFFLTEVQLIYNVVLISTVQQSDAVIHTYIYIYIYTFF